MKWIFYFTASVLLLSAGRSAATDLIGPFPESTVTPTILRATTITIPIDIPNGKLTEVLSFLNRKAAGFVIETQGKDFSDTGPVKLVDSSISLFAAAASLADQIGANILIQPGRILLVPKSKAAPRHDPLKKDGP